jgi:electron transport complex protein RnfC
MIQLYDFPGGIHPPENKELSNPGQLVTLPLPEELIIPLGQHIGAPSEAVVKKGDQQRTTYSQSDWLSQCRPACPYFRRDC